MHLRTLPIAAVFALSCSATEMFSWHVFDAAARIGSRFEVTLHQRTRTRQHLSWLDQVRTGAIVRYKTSPRLTIYSGYYFQPQHALDELWLKGHRAFVGVEANRGLGRGFTLAGRLAGERHMATGRANYNRYRSFLRLTADKSRFAPFVQNEMLAVRQGYHSMRNSGGMRFKLAPHLTAEVSFLYDVRRTVWGGDRAAVVTSLRYEFTRKGGNGHPSPE